MSFVHLHCHSEYSLLDGLSRIPEMVARAKALGQPALALTDHGVMYGAVEFWQAATDAGIKPIVGMESYLARGKMSERLPGEEHKPYHLLLLAKNMAGYKNLLKLASLAQLEGFYYKPRIDKETLAAHAEGLICTTGCLAGEIPRLLTEDGQPEKARREIGWYYEVFGPENFFFELQDHSLPELRDLNKQLAGLQPHFNARFLATNDTHYVMPEQAKPHDVLLCIQTAKLVTDPNRMKMSDGSYYLKSRAEMEAMFGQYPGALDNTLRVAEMCDLNLKSKGYHLPLYQVPEGHTPETYLRHLCEDGLRQRYGARADDPEVRGRLEYELKVIHEMGFDAYFLIVWDLGRFAQSRGIWWNVRGSGASSIVAYSSGITNLDPLRNSLIFERFLNPGRISMPDIDLDYPDDRRAEMIEYTVQKYGHDNVAQIITFGTLGARAAIRDIGRAMDIPLSEVDRIAKLVPSGPKVKLKDAFDSAEFKDLYESQDYIRQLIDTAGQLEGVSRHASTHAAGVVISDRPLVEYLPLNRPTKGADDSSLGMVTQFPMEIIEKIGLLKVDFLGLATLTIMHRACQLIEQRHGRRLDLTTIPYSRSPTDPAADADVRPLFDLLSSGHVGGIFQVESEGMRNVLTSMKPTEFEHIIAVVALYRPGPMDYIPSYVRRMHGEEPVTYHHPDLEPILQETYGICVSGDAMLFDPVTGRRFRLDEAGTIETLHLQGVADDWSPAVGRVTHWVHNGRKPVYRLSLRNGSTIKVTADHQLLTEAGWQPLKTLTVGDFVAVPDRLLGPEQTYSRERLRVLAYLIADGDLGNLAAANFVSQDSALLNEYRRCVEAFPNVRLTRTEQVRAVQRLGAAKAEVTVYHQPNELLQWLRELGLKHPAGSTPGGCRSDEKFVPEFIFALGQPDVAYFLASLWDCDGYMGRKLCHYKTISARLAADVQTLLLRLGVRSTVYENAYLNQGRHGADSITKHSYQVTVYDTARLADWLQPHMLSPKRNVACGSQAEPTIDRAAFIQEVDAATSLPRRALMAQYGISRQHFSPAGIKRPRISARVAVPLVEALALVETRRSLNTNWDEVIAIEPAGDEDVYDLTVEGLHSFVANNIIVHNCVYQEQIIQIATKLAGYSPGEADQIRKAVGKKKEEEIARHRQQFIAGCTRNGYTPAVAEAVYGDIEFFANYGFNKAHAADYAMITCQTAYLKAHYPVEYMTALLSVSRNDTAKVALYAADARRMGLRVLPPDVNLSELDFTIEKQSTGQVVSRAMGQIQSTHDPIDQPAAYSIRFGMAAVKNVGAGPVQTILEARQLGGPFKSLGDFSQRADLRNVGKRALECLIKVGALDAFGQSRGELLDGLDQVLNASVSHFRAAEAGQLSLFGGAAGGFASLQLPKAKSEITRREILSWEKELIGLYISDHPLQPVMAELQAVVTHYSQQLTEDHNGQPVVMAGVVTNLRNHHTKKGDAMGFVSVEDLQGHLELVIFPRTWREVSSWLAIEQIVVIRGRVDSKGSGQPKILVESLSRELKIIRSAEPGAPAVSAGRSAPPAVRPAPNDPPARRVAEAPPAWEEAGGPPPWLDDDLPLPDDDWLPDGAPAAVAVAPRLSVAAVTVARAAEVTDRPASTSEARGGGNDELALAEIEPDRGQPAADNGHAGSAVQAPGNGLSYARTRAPGVARARPAVPAGGPHGTPGGGMAIRRPAQRPAGAAAAAGTPTAGVDQSPRLVIVTIHTTGDKERDKRRLRRLHGLLTSYPGADRFEFAVYDYDQRNYQLRFPNDTTGYCPALERLLHELLGTESVAIEPS